MLIAEETCKTSVKISHRLFGMGRLMGSHGLNVGLVEHNKNAGELMELSGHEWGSMGLNVIKKEFGDSIGIHLL